MSLNFGQFLTPIVKLFKTKALALPSHIPWPSFPITSFMDDPVTFIFVIWNKSTYSDPFVLDDSVDVESLLWIRLQHSADQILRVLRHVRPFRIGELVLQEDFEQKISTVKPELTTTCLRRPLFWSPNLCIYNIHLPLNNDHLSRMTTILGSRGCSL